MPFKVEIDPRRALVIMVFHGRFTDDDLIAATEAIRVHPDFRPEFDQLVLGHEPGVLEVTREGIQKITVAAPIFAPTSRRAIVAPTAASYGMARMFELTRDGRAGEVRVFQSEDEALVWLDLIPNQP